MKFLRINLIDAGVSPEMTFDKSRRFRLVNISSLLAAGTTLPYILIFFQKEAFLGIVALLFFLSFCSCLLLIKFGQYRKSRILLYVLSCAYLFIISSSLGRDASHHLMLIPVLLSIVLVFDFEEKLELISLIGLVLFTFIILEVTDFSLFSISLTTQESRLFYYGSLSVAVLGSTTIGIFYFYLFGQQLEKNLEMIKTSKEIEHTINYFSSSLYGKNTVDEILWDVAKNCIGRLGFIDCVIYLLDEDKQLLIQKAAFGNKNPNAFEIYKPMDIALGDGIVGRVAETQNAIIVENTSIDKRYIADDQRRLSELAVPLIYNKKVIGVIDSEHPEKNFFTERHLNVLKTISSLCANKVAKAMADQERGQAIKIKIEADRIKAFDQLKSKLFANVSHELRTPLTLIMGTIDKHIRSNASDDWQVLRRHTDRLLRLINQLLDLSKIEASEYKLQKEPGDVMKFLRVTLSLFSSLTYNRKITLSGTIPDDSLWLKFDSDALEKVLFNLLSNAIKFTSDNSTVELTASYENELVLKISDQGPGIPSSEIDKIFDRYYQANQQRTSGTGIGLSLTKELVELHDGTISIESELGKGSTFIVSLPLEKAHPEQVEVNPSEKIGSVSSEIDSNTNQGKNNLVLVVEDNQELANHILGILQSDFELIQVPDGVKGIEIAQQRLPDLIVSDVMMQHADGFELCQTLKENELTSHIPIVLLTAKADEADKLHGLHSGADDYIIKPFSGEELKVRIKNLLKLRKKLKDKFSQIISLDSNDIVITSVDEIFIKRIISTIESNMHNEEFNVEELCIQMGISRMQMHRKLTALTGKSTSAFIRKLRLQRASKLLESGETSSQAAYAVGFNSLSYFTKMFKAEFGSAPSEFMAKQL
ncbi:MAG: ATP-binding protein [Cyclobacteriaceae bacterium]